MLRHHDVAAEWHHLCAQAFYPSAVTDKPLIHSGRSSTSGEASGTLDHTELRGDVAVRGFWHRGTRSIFDIRVADTDVPTYRGMASSKVLARHEKEKKSKYLAVCLEHRQHFTPLVFSVDGLMGCEASAAVKRLASCLSTKWGRTYSEVCGFVRSRLSMALVRSTSMCLRGSRDPAVSYTHLTLPTIA